MIVPHDLFYNVDQFPAADASGSWEMLRGAPWLQPCAAEHWSRPEEVGLQTSQGPFQPGYLVLCHLLKQPVAKCHLSRLINQF